jgi:NADH:ubiquinone oxidoreductase subunit 5 (subunit L)/multisubunit Na+/H+ antiporter MnhA subunit
VRHGIAGLTAFYMFRLYYNIFWGRENRELHAAHRPHEAPLTMTLPLVFLAAVTLVGGAIPFGHFGLRTLRRHPRGYYRRENGVIKSSRRKAVKGTPTPGCPFYHYVTERPSRHNRIGNAQNL